jgi:hypothetical protein
MASWIHLHARDATPQGKVGTPEEHFLFGKMQKNYLTSRMFPILFGPER